MIHLLQNPPHRLRSAWQEPERFSRIDTGRSASVKKYCRASIDAERLLNEAVESMCLSMRAYNRILKVARTIADLAGEETISGVHIAEAIQYRELDQKYWR